MRAKSGWEMVSMRLPVEVTDVLDELAKHLPAGPGGTPSRSVALIWALLHADTESLADVAPRVELHPWLALARHVETLGLGLS